VFIYRFYHIGPEEELLKVLDGLIASLNEVTEKAEAYYLFKDVLTRCCALVMEHNFLSDTYVNC
jgi:hypothetical protein